MGGLVLGVVRGGLLDAGVGVGGGPLGGEVIRGVGGGGAVSGLRIFMNFISDG